MRPSCCGGDGDWRVIVGLPTTLTELASDFTAMYDDYKNDLEDFEAAQKTKHTQQEDVTMKLGELQDCCPGIFAHRSLSDAYKAIEVLDLLNGLGLPKRY